MPSMQYDSLRLGLRSSSSVLLIKLRLGFKLLIARTSSEPLLMLGDWEMGLYKDEPMPLSDNQVRLRPTLRDFGLVHKVTAATKIAAIKRYTNCVLTLIYFIKSENVLLEIILIH